MIRPAPGKPYLHNLAATLIAHGNSRFTVNLERIAQENDFTAEELGNELDRQAEANSLSPNTILDDFGGEGK